jgi:hypothetical protein
VTCQPDEAAFAQLINQYGMAIAPSAMYPASTTGYGGFEIALESTYTSIHGDSDYVREGTRGQVDSETGTAATQNDSPASILQLYSLRIRKGFGFGIETGLQFGFMPKTSLISGGADLRVSLLEGFRSGAMAYVPDIAVAGSVRTITGTPEVQLTVVGVNGVISKAITVSDGSVLTPSFGYQYLFIFGDSGVIDFTPAESALQACDFQGPNIPGTPGSDVYDGSPVCGNGGTNADYNNNRVFNEVRLRRQRLFFGLNYRYEILTVGAQIMADVFNSAVKLNSDVVDENGDEVFQQEKNAGGYLGNFAFGLQVGAIF